LQPRHQVAHRRAQQVALGGLELHDVTGVADALPAVALAVFLTVVVEVAEEAVERAAAAVVQGGPPGRRRPGATTRVAAAAGNLRRWPRLYALLRCGGARVAARPRRRRLAGVGQDDAARAA